MGQAITGSCYTAELNTWAAPVHTPAFRAKVQVPSELYNVYSDSAFLALDDGVGADGGPTSKVTCTYGSSGKLIECDDPLVGAGSWIYTTKATLSALADWPWIILAVNEDDGNPCTTDQCTSSAIAHGSAAQGTSCGSSDFCHAASQCNGTGACVQGPEVDKNDFDSCTDDDCQPSTGVTHSFRRSDPACTPPAPLTVEGDLTAPTNFADGVTALVSAQQGVTGIDTTRVGVVRGRVFDTFAGQSGVPLTGVTVRALGQPTLGSTVTSASGSYSGWYDFAVNGGGDVVLEFEKTGYLPVQRRVEARWNDTTVVDDIVMIRENDQTDAQIDQGSLNWQVAQGAPTPAEGITPGRRAVVLFPPGWSVVPTSTWPSPQASLTVRATEYTSGVFGPQRMPGDLPPATGYTYATEYTITQARDQGEPSVAFTQPAISYVEAITPTQETQQGGGAALGDPIPVGSYDRKRGLWVGESPGRIVKYTGGAQVLDCGATGCEALGIVTGEKSKLATIGYAQNQLLWRFAQAHFSGWDANWGFVPPPDATFPNASDPSADMSVEGAAEICGSIIECENRVLRETIPIVGTPYAIHYSSERQEGYRQQIIVPITGPTLPTSLQFLRVEYEVQIAGQRFFGRRGASTLSPNDRVVISWDRRDGWGRRVQGSAVAYVRLAYVYAGVTQSGGGWARPSGATSIGGDRANREIKLYRTYSTLVPLAQLDAKPLGLGGWSLGAHHVFDPKTGYLYLGDGTRRSGVAAGDVLENVAGFGSGSNADNQPALGATLNPYLLAAGPDGSLYFGGGAVSGGGAKGCIRRWDPKTKLLSTVMGWPDGGGYSGANVQDDTLATSVSIFPHHIAASESEIYFTSPQQVWRIRGGKLYLVAGSRSATFGSSADGVVASGAPVTMTNGDDVAVARDGAVVFTEQHNACVRKVNPDGRLYTLAGTCGSAGTGPGSTDSAFQAISPPRHVALAPDGSAYVSLASNHIVRVTPNGRLSLVGGGGQALVGPATAVRFEHVTALAVGPSGDVFVATVNDGFSRPIVRAISPAGMVRVVAGTQTAGHSPEGALAAVSNITDVHGLAVAPDGMLYIGQDGPSPTTSGATIGIRRVRSAQRTTGSGAATEWLVPAGDGAATYVFDISGRHKRTLSPSHGSLVQSFGLAAGLLTSVTELGLQTLGVSRAGSAVTLSPPHGGPATTITLGSNGYASSITNGTQTWSPTHGDTGLLTSLVDPKGRTHTFVYDGAGRLRADKNPMQGTAGTQLSSDVGDRTRTVRVTSPEGRLRTHVLDYTGVANTKERRTHVTEGVTTVYDMRADGSFKSTGPDGATSTTTTSSDTDRWYTLAPWAKKVEQTRGSFTRTVDATQHTVVLDAGGPAAVTSQTDKWHVAGAASGKDANASYSSATSTWTFTSPERALSTSAGTEGKIVVDGYDRPTRIQRTGASPTLSDIEITYGTSGAAQGRVTEVRQGSRTVAFGYAASGGWLSSVATSGLGTVTYGDFDGVGRARAVALPAPPNQARNLVLQYDPVGNVTSVQLPKGPTSTHGFVPNAVDFLAQYTPPVVGSPAPSLYAYDRDRLLTSYTPPAQSATSYARDGAGRVTQRATPEATVDFAYEAGTGKLVSAGVQGGVTNTFTYCGGNGPPGPTGLLCRETIAGVVPNSGAKTIDYAYDARMRLSKRTLEGREVGFQYDDDDRLVAVTLGTTEILRLAYSTSGVLSSVTAKEGGQSKSESYGYANGTGDLTHIGDTAIGYAFDYEREASTGRVSRWQETFPGAQPTDRRFTYDGANRLASEKLGQGTPSLIPYDAHGNVDAPDSVKLDPVLGSIPHVGSTTYDAQDRISGGGGWAHWVWNANGDLATISNNLNDYWSTYNFQYDSFGNLRSATGPWRSLSYTIDAFDRRVRKAGVWCTPESYLYDASGRIVAFYDTYGTLLGQFVYASRGHVPDLMIDGAGGVYRIVTDHLGSVRLVYRVSNGGVVEQMSYGVFGLPSGWGRAVPFGFAGGLWDADLGMVRFGARDFDPYKGRWVTKDRSRFGGGLNFYQYSNGDPVDYIDASGKNPILLFGGIVAAWAFWALNSPTHDGSVVVGGAYLALGMGGAWAAAGARAGAGASVCEAAAGASTVASTDEDLVEVTSWAERGVTPDLNPGRWVMLGRATPWNFLNSGLMGPKAFISESFPFLRLEASRVPMSNSITGTVPATMIEWPPGLEGWKGVLGQRVLKQ